MAKLPIPTIRDRVAYAFNRSTTAATLPGLQGSAVSGSTGGTVTNATTYREVLCVAGHAAARVRLLTVTSTGTLTVTPIRPEVAPAGIPDEAVYTGSGLIDPTKVVKYTTGGVAKTVAAATECVVDIALAGENYVLVEFACTLTGSITYCDASSIDFATVSVLAQTGAAATLAGTSSTNAALVALPGDWSTSNLPAAATLATCNKAIVTGVRHVVTSLNVTISTGATAITTPVTVILSDTSGTLWSDQVILPANGLYRVSLTGLNIVGFLGSAVTLATTAPPAGAFASVAMTGHDAA